jgi:hypothetical protein
LIILIILGAQNKLSGASLSGEEAKPQITQHVYDRWHHRDRNSFYVQSPRESHTSIKEHRAHLFCHLFSPEDGGKMFLRNAGKYLLISKLSALGCTIKQANPHNNPHNI